MSEITGLAAVEFTVTDLEHSVEFYRNVWALEPVGEAWGALAFRASGPDNYVVGLRGDAEPGLSASEWSVHALADLEQLFARLRKRYPVVSDLSARQDDGGGCSFAISDRFGRAWRFSAGVARRADGAPVPERPYKLSHVVMNSPDIDSDVRFAIDELGFRLRDESKSMVFLGCNADHHSLAFTRVPSLSLNHVAFEVPSLDAVMRNAGRLKRKGFPMQWGVGRHGPGANVFSYFLDPDDLPIEYTAEIEQVDDATHQPGSPAVWERPPFWDAWGLAEPPTERFRDASAGLRPHAFATPS